jgi:branched-chain amino acid transport system ATP-binding protein
MVNQNEYSSNDDSVLIEPIVKVHDLCKISGSDCLVRNFSLQVGRGEIVGVIGKALAGKEAMLNLLSGATSPTSGQIVFDGEDITHLPREHRTLRGISRSLSGSDLLPNLTVFENVLVHGITGQRPLFPRKGGGTDNDEALALLELVGLIDQARGPAGSITPGQKWLLTIAIAMATKPALLLIDCKFECATTHAIVLDVLRRITDQGISIIFASQAWHPIMDACTRIEILRDDEFATGDNDTDSPPDRCCSPYAASSTSNKAKDGSTPPDTGFNLRRLLKRGLLQGRTQRRSERGYSRFSDG